MVFEKIFFIYLIISQKNFDDFSGPRLGSELCRVAFTFYRTVLTIGLIFAGLTYQEALTCVVGAKYSPALFYATDFPGFPACDF